jgi:uncharacterized protein (DUF1800 family)
MPSLASSAGADVTPASASRPRLRALNRFGLGARPGDPDRMSDPHTWLLRQIGPAPTIDGASLPNRTDGIAAARRVREATRLEAARNGAETATVDGGRAEPPAAVQEARSILHRERLAALSRRVATERPFAERLVAFWSNHLCVSTRGSPDVAPLAGHYERTVIRPHVFGRFEDMVLASACHPALQMDLEPGARTIAGNGSSPAWSSEGRGRERRSAHAHRLLSRHTLGPNGPHDRSDVTALARMLPYWSLSRADGDEAGFAALPASGPQTILGTSYDPAGEAQTRAALRNLCRHPATARFVSAKLVHHVASDPPASAVETVADVFADTGGDLEAVSRCLVETVAVGKTAGRKFRTPQDWLIAGLRGLGAVQFSGDLLHVLDALNHRLWAPSSPSGYSDRRADWAAPDALMNRAEQAGVVAAAAGSSSPPAPSDLIEVAPIPTSSRLAGMLRDPDIPPTERIALALGGPAFQWR